MKEIDLEPKSYRRSQIPSWGFFWFFFVFLAAFLLWQVSGTWQWGDLLRFGFPALLLGILLGVKFRDSDF